MKRRQMCLLESWVGVRHAICFVVLTGLALAVPTPRTFAAELPPPLATDYVIETHGPNWPLDNGGVYPDANGYFVALKVPCAWPANTPIHLDIFSPEMNTTYGHDEVYVVAPVASQSTTFQLFQPGTPTQPTLPGPSSPGSIAIGNYPPSNLATQWVRFHTLNPSITCGIYLLRSQARGGDGNSWRIRIGVDNDANPNNAPPTNYDNPDGLPGTADELAIGTLQSVFKHVPNTNQCFTLHEYVTPGQTFISFHNYDLESSGTVTYISPSGQSTAGTPSPNQSWNNGTATDRGSGDTIRNPEGGWWQIVTCAGSDVHIIQEGQTGVIGYNYGGLGQTVIGPPSPNLMLTQLSGPSEIKPGDVLTYQIVFTNTSNTYTPPLYPGSAINTVLNSTVPRGTTYVGCGVDAPTTGACLRAGDTVTYTIDRTQDATGGTVGTNGVVKPGAGGRVHLVVRVDDTINDPVTGVSKVDYKDGFNQQFTAWAQEIDSLGGYKRFMPVVVRQ